MCIYISPKAHIKCNRAGDYGRKEMAVGSGNKNNNNTKEEEGKRKQKKGIAQINDDGVS